MKASTKSFHFFFNLGIIQPHIPSKGNVTKTILKEVNQQFLVMDHLSHFAAVSLEISYRVLTSCIFDNLRHPKLLRNDYVRDQTHLNNLYIVK